MEQDKKKAELEQERILEQEKKLQQEEESMIEIELEQEEEEFESIEKEIESSEVLEKKKRREAIFEMALFFILGVLLGVTIKTEAVKKITIGFNDYQINQQSERYDVSDLKKKLDDQIAKEQQQQELQQAPTEQQ